MTIPNSRGTRVVGMLSVAVVAIVAAVVSYAHMQTVADKAGEGWRSWLEPLSVDGLLVGASLVLYVRRSSRFAWLAVSMGILVSLAANLAAAHPTLISRLVSAWPAVALALSYETLLTLVRRTPDDDQQDQLVTPPQPPVVAATATIDDRPVVPPVPALPASPESGDLLEQARQLVEQARKDGAPLGRTRLARQLGITEGDARRLLSQLNQDTKKGQNGHTSVPVKDAGTTDMPVITSDESDRDGALVGTDPYAWMRQ